MRYAELIFIVPNNRKKIDLWTDEDLIDFIGLKNKKRKKNGKKKN